MILDISGISSDALAAHYHASARAVAMADDHAH
ncbi:hypothetical protein RD1_3360 [Roseobacter denitrificans OCh 114]|uniref:Uncharacterized protein n=1 Tax=Roseobacter denitrificans (strain ATCC 33942 / OCh 114) TaxID=375451 RepID=Q163I7_ROSDO|nr:hypothetical protein RD1_3360 [Roseobacter denitrificans OCh 114]